MNKKYLILIFISAILFGLSAYFVYQAGPFLYGSTPFIEKVLVFPYIVLTSPLYFLGIFGVFLQARLIETIFGFVISLTISWAIIFYIYFIVYERYMAGVGIWAGKIFLQYLPIIIAIGMLAVSVFMYITHDKDAIIKCIDGTYDLKGGYTNEGDSTLHPFSGNTPRQCFQDAISSQNLFGDLYVHWQSGDTFDMQKHKEAIDFCKKMPSDREITDNTTWIKDIIPSHTTYRDYCFINLAEYKSNEIAGGEAISRSEGSYDEALQKAYASPLIIGVIDQICKESGKIDGENKYQECLHFMDLYTKRIIQAGNPR